jgi:undecaprenyl-diphosphatase
MTLFQAIILGIVQGITEFLPISSSGHLVLVPNLLGWKIPPDQAFSYNVLLQAATLLAVFSFFYKDFLNLARASFESVKQKRLVNHDAKLALYILLTTIPAGLVGIALNGLLRKVFSQPVASAFFLIVTAFLLILAEKLGDRTKSLEDISWLDSLWIGIFQIFALLPGISRSGITITGGMFRDLDRTSSASFSFLISFPLLIAAGIDGLYSFIKLPNTTESLFIFLVGSIISAIVGFLSIKWLLRFLSHRKLYTFSVYCILFAILNIYIIIR